MLKQTIEAPTTEMRLARITAERDHASHALDAYFRAQLAAEGSRPSDAALLAGVEAAQLALAHDVQLTAETPRAEAAEAPAAELVPSS